MPDRDTLYRFLLWLTDILSNPACHFFAPATFWQAGARYLDVDAGAGAGSMRSRAPWASAVTR